MAEARIPMREPSVFIPIALIITCVKILLIPSYRSTDFDVHRNWLALTRELPVHEWYFDDQKGETVHTLDYPPGFAWFEWVVGRNFVTNFLLEKGVFDSRCLEQLPDNDNDVSESCVVFHRSTVILSDLVFIMGAYFCADAVFRINRKPGAEGASSGGVLLDNRRKQAITATVLVVCNPGILLLDHVHFQYNGMLLGVLLFSIGFIVRAACSTGASRVRQNVMGAILFTALLTMKHLYLILAPLYFVYLLRHCCFFHTNNSPRPVFSVRNFVKLAIATVVTVAVPFAPFLVQSNPREQMVQLLKRLFPFSRGLCHDYWAANVWALYLFADKCLSFLARKVNISVLRFSFPIITPNISAILLLVSILPALFAAWRVASFLIKDQTSTKIRGIENFFLSAVVYCAFSAFMLAYHVHEKAIMTVIIPLTFLAPTSREHAQLYLRTCALGHFALFPLLFGAKETTFKVAAYVTHLAFAVFALEYLLVDSIHDARKSRRGLITFWDRVGMVVLIILFIFVEIVHPVLFKPSGRLEFLPLLMISVSCAIGLIGCWIHSGILMLKLSNSCTVSMNRNGSVVS